MALIKKYVHLLVWVQSGNSDGVDLSGIECYFMEENGILLRMDKCGPF
jgi:hypothetical protein